MSDIIIRNFINGEWQDEVNGKRVPLYNPSTGGNRLAGGKTGG